MSSSLQHHVGMVAERRQRHLGVVLGADRQHDAAIDQLLQRHLEVLEGLAVGAAAEHDAVDPVVADDPAPERVVEVEHDRPSRQAEPRRQHGGGVARHDRQALGREGHLGQIPAAVVEPDVGAHAAGEERQVDVAHVLGGGLAGEVAVDAGDDAPPRAVEAEGVMAERVAAGRREAHLQDHRRRPAAHRRPDARPARHLSVGVSLRRVAEGTHPERAMIGCEDEDIGVGGEKGEVRIKRGVEVLAEVGLLDGQRDAEPGRREAQQRRECAGGPGPHQADGEVAAHAGPGLHRAAVEQARRGRPGAEARGRVHHVHQPGGGGLGAAGGEVRARQLDAEPTARQLAQVCGFLVGARGGVKAPGEQMGVANLLQRGEFAVDVAHRRGAPTAATDPGARRPGGAMAEG